MLLYESLSYISKHSIWTFCTPFYKSLFDNHYLVGYQWYWISSELLASVVPCTDLERTYVGIRVLSLASVQLPLKLEVVTLVLPSMYFQESLVIPVVIIVIAKVIFCLVWLKPGKRYVQVPLWHSAYLQDHISTIAAEGQEAVFSI